MLQQRPPKQSRKRGERVGLKDFLFFVGPGHQTLYSGLEKGSVGSMT